MQNYMRPDGRTRVQCAKQVVQDVSMQLESWLVKRVSHDDKDLLQEARKWNIEQSKGSQGVA